MFVWWYGIWSEGDGELFVKILFSQNIETPESLNCLICLIIYACIYSKVIEYEMS